MALNLPIRGGRSSEGWTASFPLPTFPVLNGAVDHPSAP